jgi:hypothetical protein
MIAYTLGQLLIGGAPLAAQGECKIMLDAASKMYAIPNHSYTAMKIDGKDYPAEMIYAAGAFYTKLDGKWSLSPLTRKDMEQSSQKNRENSKATCRYVKDEPVAGEMAAVYVMHEDTGKGKVDSQVWISKSKGLLLRQEIDVDVGRSSGKTHTSMRWEYDNVKPPL